MFQIFKYWVVTAAPLRRKAFLITFLFDGGIFFSFFPPSPWDRMAESMTSLSGMEMVWDIFDMAGGHVSCFNFLRATEIDIIGA
jgi:hypothetical protein